MVIKYCNNTCKASKVDQHRHGKKQTGKLGTPSKRASVDQKRPSMYFTRRGAEEAEEKSPKGEKD